MVARREIERRRLADPADLDRILLRFAVGRLVARRIRNAIEELLPTAFGRRQLLFQRLQLCFDCLELGQLLRRRLPLQLPLRAQLLDARLDFADGEVGLEQLVEELARPFAGKRDSECIGIVAGGAEVDHARESR